MRGPSINMKDLSIRNKSRMKYITNIKSSVFLNIFKIIFQFICSILLSRSVGAVGQGMVAYYFLVFDLIGTYGNFGITHATTYFYKAGKIPREQISSVNGTYLSINGGILSMLVLICFFTTSFFSAYSLPLVILGCLYFVSVYFYNLFHEIIVGDENISGMNVMIFICTALKFGIVVGAFLGNALTVEIYIIAQAASNILMAVLLGFKAKVRFTVWFDTPLLIEEFRFGMIVYLSALFGYLNYRIDQFMIKWMMTETDLGVYSIAVTISELAFFVPTCISAALSGKLYNSSLTEKRTVLCLTLKFSILACLLVILAGSLGAFLIPYVYGSEFVGSIIPTIILLLGTLFASIGKLIAPYYISIGKPVVHMIVAIVISVVNIILNLFTIPLWGIIGAALSSVGSYIVYGMIYIVLLRKKEAIPFKTMLFVGKQDIEHLKSMA